MIDKLLLQSGNPIPFIEAQVIITPPTVKQISFLGEDDFYSGCTLISFAKDLIITGDNFGLLDIDDFEVIMSVMRDSRPELESFVSNIIAVLNLIFPTYEVSIIDQGIMLEDKENNEVHFITKMNYRIFQQIIQEMFCLDFGISGRDYNPVGKRAKEIADKLRAAKAKRQQNKRDNSDDSIEILRRYVLLLSVGENKSQEELLNLTVYQITQEFRTFQAKEAWDSYIAAIRAGASKIDKVEYWMNDLDYSEDETVNYV